MGLVDEWNASREERTGMAHGERVASVESGIGASMRGGPLAWLADRDDPEAEASDEERGGWLSWLFGEPEAEAEDEECEA